MKQITYGYGQCYDVNTIIAKDEIGIIMLEFIFPDMPDPLHQLKRQYPNADLREDNAIACEICKLLNRQKEVTFPLHLIGTPFQKTVWKELLHIPFGTTTTYQQIANRIGKPKAVRAVGTAIGRNPISLIVPCHRVIHTNGSISGYRWGKDLKKKILIAESNDIK